MLTYDEMTWRDRFLIRFKQPPSTQLAAFINSEIAFAVQKERKRLQNPHTPPPLPCTWPCYDN